VETQWFPSLSAAYEALPAYCEARDNVVKELEGVIVEAEARYLREGV